MPTANVVTSQSGTGFTINVTACNLLTDITVKDFYVLHGGVLFCNGQTDGCSAYAKVTPSSVQYSGASLAANTTVEVRRYTPRSVLQVINYGNRFSSSTWNSELDRGVRRAEEYDLNGVGAGSIVQIATPSNTPYPTGWSTNTVNPPTQAAAYAILNTLAPINSPVLLGTPQSTTPATNDASANIATTQYVQNNLVNYAPLSSPALNGVPTSTTPATSDNTTKIATTAYVQNNLASYETTAAAASTYAPLSGAALSSPVITGGTVNASPSLYDNTTKLASTSFVQAAYRPSFSYYRSTASGSNSGNLAISFPTAIYDTDSTFGGTTFNVPANAAGKYLFICNVFIQNNQAAAQPVSINLQIGGSNQVCLGQATLAASGGSYGFSGSCILSLAAGNSIEMAVNTASTAWIYGTGSYTQTQFSGIRLGT